jgi:hypothetical protein
MKCGQPIEGPLPPLRGLMIQPEAGPDACHLGHPFNITFYL